ncbi:unnamed protein product [Chrysoparadoxa australica]
MGYGAAAVAWMLLGAVSVQGFMPAAGGMLSSSYQDTRSNSARNMFSGIVEEIGVVTEMGARPDMPLWDGSTGEGVELVVEGDIVLDGASLGCSIAVNGVCLTVTELYPTSFRVGLAPETLRLSNLADLKSGDKVNLERALGTGTNERNSGHYVQGHVDNMGTILSLTPEGDSLWIKVQVPKDLIRYIVPKGFVAIDGTSLTVCEVNAQESWFTFMLVAYTQQHVIIPSKTHGSKVNIEVDVMAKYAERSLGAVLDRLETLETQVSTSTPKTKAPSMNDMGMVDMKVKVEKLEHMVRNRDYIIESMEERLDALEKK